MQIDRIVDGGSRGRDESRYMQFVRPAERPCKLAVIDA